MSVHPDKVFPAPVQRELKAAEFFLHGRPHFSVIFMERAAHDIAGARQLPGYPPERLQQDEHAYIEMLCKMLNADEFNIASLSETDCAHLKELCLRKVYELLPHEPAIALHIAERANAHFPNSVSLPQVLHRALGGDQGTLPMNKAGGEYVKDLCVRTVYELAPQKPMQALHLTERTNTHFPDSVSVADVVRVALENDGFDLEKMRKSDCKHLKDLCVRTVKSLTQQDKALAFTAAEHACKLFPQSVSLNEALGNLYFDFERYESALPHLRFALDANPEHFTTARRLHKCYLKLHQSNNAAALVHHYKYGYPENQHTLLMRGYHLIYMGQLDEALTVAERAYDAYDHFPAALKLKAVTYLKMGDETEAQYWFDAYEAIEAGRLAAAPRVNNLALHWRHLEADMV